MAPVSPGAANALPATAIPAVSISAAEPMNIARGYRLTSISDCFDAAHLSPDRESTSDLTIATRASTPNII
jgi:hypothetical protein